jgi:hypothetical protein
MFSMGLLMLCLGAHARPVERVTVSHDTRNRTRI